MDRKLLYLPEKMQNWINEEKDEYYLKAFTHLHDCFFNYFSTPLDERVKPDIQWINFPFIMNYPPAQAAMKDLRANLFNDAALKKLMEKLGEAGAFKDEKTEFNFWNTDPTNWSEISFQSRKVKLFSPSILRSIRTLDLPAQYWALGDFTINAIPEGYVERLKNGKYKICINKIYYFINDSFNFEGDEPLGPWNLDYINKPLHIIYPDTFLENIDFQKFQRHGFGRYFPVLSRLHELEDFNSIYLRYPFGTKN